MGNRGCLHSPEGRIVRPFQLKRWIYCLLRFKERRRTVMTPGHYTELFFLDEATALAAGHRPCAECQRLRYKEYLDAWLRAYPETALPLRAGQVDFVLHEQRIDESKQQQTYEAQPDSLPNGVIVTVPQSGNQPFLWTNSRLFQWTPAGYEPAAVEPDTDAVQVLTPRSTVAALAAGFEPILHPSVYGNTTKPTDGAR